MLSVLKFFWQNLSKS